MKNGVPRDPSGHHPVSADLAGEPLEPDDGRSDWLTGAIDLLNRVGTSLREVQLWQYCCSGDRNVKNVVVSSDVQSLRRIHGKLEYESDYPNESEVTFGKPATARRNK